MRPQTERSDFLDGLRGLALFGILIVNLAAFKAPVWARPSIDHLIHDAPLHRTAEILIFVFAGGKFFILLAFLLGIGIGWQIQRCEERGKAPRRFIARRMIILFLFGCLHISLLWIGDILLPLALTGLLGLLFARTRDRTLRITGTIVYLGGVAIFAGLMVFYSYLIQTEDFQEYYGEGLRRFDEILHIYRNGSWAEIAAVRLGTGWQLYFKNGLVMGPSMLAFLLWGMLAARRLSPASFREDITRKFGPRAFLALLLAGILFNTASTLALFGAGLPADPGLAYYFTLIFYTLGTPLLTLAYVTGIALWWSESARPSFLCTGLAAVGRTALSNYLLQSVIGTTLFYGYGFGLYGHLGIAWIPVLAVVIFTFQMILSRYWLTRFRYGPAEWLWRSLTYRGAV